MGLLEKDVKLVDIQALPRDENIAALHDLQSGRGEADGGYLR
jgi:hypothetical protein